MEAPNEETMYYINLTNIVEFGSIFCRTGYVSAGLDIYIALHSLK